MFKILTTQKNFGSKKFKKNFFKKLEKSEIFYLKILNIGLYLNSDKLSENSGILINTQFKVIYLTGRVGG